MSDYEEGPDTIRMWNKVFNTLTLDEVISVIYDDFPVRETNEVFMSKIEKKMTKLGITKKEVIKRIKEQLGRKNDTNVDNWVKKKMDRDSVLKTAFGLEITYDETDVYLKKCLYDGFYMRDVKDIIYRFFLKMRIEYNDEVSRKSNNLLYKDLEEMLENYKGLYFHNSNPNPDPILIKKIENNKFTKFLEDELKRIKTLKDLKDYLERNKSLFGSYRRKTHEIFMENYEQIENQLSSQENRNITRENEIILNGLCSKLENTIISIEEKEKIKRRIEDIKKGKIITEEEIRDEIVDNISNLEEDVINPRIRELITQNIPRREEFSQMLIKSVKKDGEIYKNIDRKLLILTWLSCNNGDITNFIKGEARDNFESHYKIINDDILTPCGMPLLDPRHPFDWIIFNALYASHLYNEEDYIDDSPKERLRKLFKRINRL
ncbi:MAG: hypothetical protein LBH16_06830 [Treponema sp.]|jgi:hypothetical protein|nr:hypothetical protein [Treponema sp.]